MSQNDKLQSLDNIIREEKEKKKQKRSGMGQNGDPGDSLDHLLDDESVELRPWLKRNNRQSTSRSNKRQCIRENYQPKWRTGHQYQRRRSQSMPREEMRSNNFYSRPPQRSWSSNMRSSRPCSNCSSTVPVLSPFIQETIKRIQMQGRESRRKCPRDTLKDEPENCVPSINATIRSMSNRFASYYTNWDL